MDCCCFEKIYSKRYINCKSNSQLFSYVLAEMLFCDKRKTFDVLITYIAGPNLNRNLMVALGGLTPKVGRPTEMLVARVFRTYNMCYA